jgi:hypothetical protein
MLCCILQNGDSGESEAAAPHIITIYYLNKMHLGEIAPSVVTRFPGTQHDDPHIRRG